MARVEVILPAHNAARTIGKALASVDAQSEGGWRITVIDDGSSDETAEIVQRSGIPVRLLRKPEALGPAGARNSGLALARRSDPDFYALLDADDRWETDYLESQLAAFERCRKVGRRVGIVACDARVSKYGRITSESWLSTVGVRAEPNLTLMLSRNRVFVSALITADAMHAAGGFDEDLWGTEDYDLWLRILELGYEVCLNRSVLVTYSDDGGSVSADTAGQSRNVVLALRKAIERGRLSMRQRVTTMWAIQFHEAQATVADLLRGDASLKSSAFLFSIPRLVIVALLHPRLWGSWFRAVMRARS